MKTLILAILILISSSKLDKIDKIYIYFDGYSCINCQPGVIYAFGNLRDLGLEDKIVLVNKQTKKKIKDYNLKLIYDNNDKFIIKNITEDTLYTNNMGYFKPIIIKLKNNDEFAILRNGVPYSKKDWAKLLDEAIN